MTGRVVALRAYRMRLPRLAGVLALGAICVGSCTSAGAQTIDRVLAVVAGTPITLSDLTAALRFGFVPSAPAANVERAALEALIDRHLQLIEVHRYLPPEPPDADVAAQLTAIRGRFASDAAFDAALAETSLDAAQLRARVRDTLRLQSYVQQRFGSGFEPSDDEILRYYRTHPSEFTRDATLRPYPEAREDARRRLIESRSGSLMRDWLAGLRRRADVIVLAK